MTTKTLQSLPGIKDREEMHEGRILLALACNGWKKITR